MSKMHTEEEQEDFLEKVEDTYQKVQDIISGKLDIEELDKIELENKKKEELQQKIVEMK